MNSKVGIYLPNNLESPPTWLNVLLFNSLSKPRTASPESSKKRIKVVSKEIHVAMTARCYMIIRGKYWLQYFNIKTANI